VTVCVAVDSRSPAREDSRRSKIEGDSADRFRCRLDIIVKYPSSLTLIMYFVLFVGL
jgi:hypothetical protein